MSGTPEYYVYYRVTASEVAAARAAVDAFQAAWRTQHPGGRARRLQRVEAPSSAAASDAPHDPTWMETYAGATVAGHGSRQALERALRAGPPDCAAWTRGERHLEIFEAV